MSGDIVSASLLFGENSKWALSSDMGHWALRQPLHDAKQQVWHSRCSAWVLTSEQFQHWQLLLEARVCVCVFPYTPFQLQGTCQPTALLQVPYWNHLAED